MLILTFYTSYTSIIMAGVLKVFLQATTSVETEFICKAALYYLTDYYTK